MRVEKLSVVERTILANQFEIMAMLTPDDASHYETKIEILRRGYEGLYYDIFDQISDPKPAEIITEVHDILTMYRAVTPSIDALSPEEQTELNLSRIKFRGFDANNDPHYSIADFLIKKKGLYDELSKMYLNSHSSGSIDRYRAMLVVFDKILPELSYRSPYLLTKSELTALVDA